MSRLYQYFDSAYKYLDAIVYNLVQTHSPSLKLAIQNNDLPRVRQILDAGTDVNKSIDIEDIEEFLHQYQSSNFVSPLFYATQIGFYSIVEYLIERGADLEKEGIYDQHNFRNSHTYIKRSSCTPLGISIIQGTHDITFLLLNAGGITNQHYYVSPPYSLTYLKSALEMELYQNPVLFYAFNAEHNSLRNFYSNFLPALSLDFTDIVQRKAVTRLCDAPSIIAESSTNEEKNNLVKFFDIFLKIANDLSYLRREPAINLRNIGLPASDEQNNDDGLTGFSNGEVIEETSLIGVD